MLPTFTALFEAHRWLCITRRIRYGERALQLSPGERRPVYDELRGLVAARLGT